MGRSTVERWLREGRRDRGGPYGWFADAVEEAHTVLEAELDSIEWKLATDESVPAGTRLRAVQRIRNRVFNQGRRDVHVAVSGHVELRAGDDEAPPSRHLVTDTQLRQMPTELLQRFLAVLEEVTAYGEPNAKQRVFLGSPRRGPGCAD